jgi:DNA-binding PadR family transcriptional regulator
MTQPLLTYTGARIAECFLATPDAELYGLDITNSIGTPRGVVYPVLERWQKYGWVTARDETPEEAKERRGRGAPRRYWLLTPQGKAGLRDYVRRWQVRQSTR